eukprot:3026598-Amphidinium_carterae.1
MAFSQIDSQDHFQAEKDSKKQTDIAVIMWFEEQLARRGWEGHEDLSSPYAERLTWLRAALTSSPRVDSATQSDRGQDFKKEFDITCDVACFHWKWLRDASLGPQKEQAVGFCQ